VNDIEFIILWFLSGFLPFLLSGIVMESRSPKIDFELVSLSILSGGFGFLSFFLFFPVFIFICFQRVFFFINDRRARQ
jgi:hypothetical protein